MIQRRRIYAIISGMAAMAVLGGAAFAAPVRIGSFTEQVKDPVRIAVDSQGKVYATEASGNAVKIFDRNGKLLKKARVPRPTGIAVSAAGLVYVGSEKNKSVEVYSADLVHLRRLTTEHISRPSGIAVDADGLVYVTDTRKDRVLVYNSEGAIVRTIGTSGSLNGQFIRPKGITVSDAAGEVFVSDFPVVQPRGSSPTSGARIQVFTKAGQFVRSFGQYGFNVGEIATPEALALDSAGRLYVADSGQGAVHILDPATGASLGALYDLTRAMALPLGIAVAKNNVAYVASYGTSSIEVYGLDGYVLMSVSDVSLSFEAVQYGPDPAAKPVTISNNGSGVLNWTAAADKAWIAVHQAAGTTAGGAAAELAVSVNIAALSTGVHKGTVTITSDFGQVDTIGVTLSILPPPMVVPSNGTLLFAGKKGKELLPQAVTISVQNSASLAWSASSDTPWLSISPASGTTTSKTAVSVNTAGLAIGTHTGSITIAAPGAMGDGGKIAVSLTITSSTRISVITNRTDAGFTLSGPASYKGSGSTWSIEDVPAGDYTITYDAVAGYRKPAPETRTVAEDGETVFSGDYVSFATLAGKRNIIAAGAAGEKNHSLVKAYRNTGEDTKFELIAFKSGSGANIASADVDGDGVAELIAGTGESKKGSADVRVFKADKSLLAEFTPFDRARGVKVAAADLDGDGAAEIIAASSGKDDDDPVLVRVYTLGKDKKMAPTGVELKLRGGEGGVSISAADTAGDGRSRIITAAAGGRDHDDDDDHVVNVTVWTIDAGKTGSWTAAASKPFGVPGKNGASVAAADFDGDGADEIVLGTRSLKGDASDVVIVAGDGVEQSRFTIAGQEHGITIAAADLDGDGIAEVVVGAEKKEKNRKDRSGRSEHGGSAEVRIYSAAGGLQKKIIPFDSVKQGINVAIGDMGL